VEPEPAKTEPAETDPPVAAGQYVDQYAKIDPEKAEKATCKKTKDGLVFRSDQNFGRIDLPVKPGASYAIFCTTVFTTPSHDLLFVLPVGKTGVTLSWSAFGNKFGGLNKINGKYVKDPGNPSATKAFNFKEGREYKLRVKVETSDDNAEIRAWIDGKNYFQWKGKTSELKSACPYRSGTISLLLAKTGVILKSVKTRSLE
jgi:hypothetical protein